MPNKKELRVSLDDDLINDKDWVHFLGLGRLDWACFLTSIQRQIRKHHNPNIILSFDAAIACFLYANIPGDLDSLRAPYDMDVVKKS